MEEVRFHCDRRIIAPKTELENKRSVYDDIQHVVNEVKGRDIVSETQLTDTSRG